MGHSFHGVQALWPAVDEKEPSAQGAHVRSELAVASAVMYEPAPHMVRTERQASALSFGEKEEPTKQAAHWRSSVAEPAWDCPVLIAHVRHAVSSVLWRCLSCHNARQRFD